MHYGFSQDFDNDNVIDFLDLDDDNDGIRDKDENRCVKANADDGVFTGPSLSTIIWDFPTGELLPFFLTDVAIGEVFTVDPTSFIRKPGDYTFTINFSNAVLANEIVLVIFDYDRFGLINFSVTGGTASSSDFIALQYNGERMLTYNPNSGDLTRSSSISISNPSEGVALVGSGTETVSSITIQTIGVSSGDQIGYFVTTPPYCDQDQDGILNSMDLDSDNDGIYDVVEANGVLSGSLAQPGRAKDDNDNTDNSATNGIPSSAGVGLSLVETTIGISNHLNIDSDGDSCNDTSEAGFTDQNYDGVLGPATVIVDRNGIVTTGSDGYTDPGSSYLDDTNTTVCNTSITINTPIAGDNIVNQKEAEQIEISGSTTGAIENQPIRIRLTDDFSNVLAINTQTQSDGRWIVSGIDISGFVDGNVLITAQIVNQFGFSNQEEFNIVLDQTAPVVNSFSTNELLPVLRGLSEPNSTVIVEISLESNAVIASYMVTSASDGSWQIDTAMTAPISGAFPILENDDSIRVSATDVAGNIDLGTVFIDTISPRVESYVSSLSKPILRGKGESNEGLRITVDVNEDGIPDVVYQIMTDNQNNWNIDPEVEIPVEGAFPEVNSGDMINIQAIDQANNIGIGTVLIDFTDTDGDGFPDVEEETSGSDVLDPCDPDPTAIPSGDCDQDGINNQFEIGFDSEDLQDTDADGIPDVLDNDDDNDGLLTTNEMPDPNGDGNPIDAIDSNGNGVPNYLEVNTRIDNAEDGITVFAAISPNGDDLNDVLVIQGIEKLKNSIAIFNRWGVKVFETKNYGSNQNYFTGIASKGNTVAKSDGLPVGTYYYVLEYTLENGELKRKTGYFYLNK